MVDRPVQDKAIVVLSVKALSWITLQPRLLEICICEDVAVLHAFRPNQN